MRCVSLIRLPHSDKCDKLFEKKFPITVPRWENDGREEGMRNEELGIRNDGLALKQFDNRGCQIVGYFFVPHGYVDVAHAVGSYGVGAVVEHHHAVGEVDVAEVV